VRRAVLASKPSLQPGKLAGGVAQATIHVQPIFNASSRAFAQFSTGHGLLFADGALAASS
jgi:hypothetical protein